MSAYRHVYLLVSLLLVIVVRPFVTPQFGTAALEGLTLLALVTGVYCVEQRRSQRVTVAVLGAAAVVTRIGWLSTSTVGLLHGFLALYVLFYVLVAVLLVQSLFREGQRVDRDTLCGAISVYLMFGLLWSAACAWLELLIPGSFLIQGSPMAGVADFERFLGFSFATLTTVGYGNIAPASPRADALAALEAILGQAYLAIVIARLVALHLTADEPPRGRQPKVSIP